MFADPESITAFLQRLSWISLPTQGLGQSFANHGRVLRLSKNQTLQVEGDEGNGLTIILFGSVDLLFRATGDRLVHFGQMGVGEAFGQAIGQGNLRRAMTVISAEDSIILRLSETALEKIALAQPDIWRAINLLHALNMKKVLRLSVQAIALPARQRIAARLLAFDENRLESRPLAFSQQSLAEMMGLARKTVNQALTEFERAGLIITGYGQIRLENRAGLRRIAES